MTSHHLLGIRCVCAFGILASRGEIGYLRPNSDQRTGRLGREEQEERGRAIDGQKLCCMSCSAQMQPLAGPVGANFCACVCAWKRSKKRKRHALKKATRECLARRRTPPQRLHAGCRRTGKDMAWLSRGVDRLGLDEDRQADPFAGQRQKVPYSAVSEKQEANAATRQADSFSVLPRLHRLDVDVQVRHSGYRK